ncbi:PH domain-containing protein [Actinacidiphila sp. bgisy167]|uniref:PH domain-containing protein n=1 Tax=Actinacidiphila sp. bgisy167 TaxID=3413797 RepID=UPI003D732194
MTSAKSPARIPARPWLSADARRWAAVRPPRWAAPRWPAAALLASVIAAIACAPYERCTASAPCGPMWLDAVGTIAFFVHMVWLLVLPEAALVSAPLLLLSMADPDMWAGGAAERLADTAVLAALCWGWAAVLARLRVRRTQRALALEAAGGLVMPVPESAAPAVRRGVLRVVAGLVVLVAAGGAAVLAIADDRADERHAAVARTVGAIVVSDDAEDRLVVRFGDGSRHDVDVAFPEDYDRGAHVPVLVDGEWTRLAAEPYRDHFGLQLLAVAGGGAAVSLLLSGVLTAARAAALRRGAAPALRVFVRGGGGGSAVHPFDGADGEPVLTYASSAYRGAPRGEAVLYGLPCEGAELVLLGTTTKGRAVVETTVAPARPWSPSHPQDRDRRAHAEHRRKAEAEIAEAAAAMGPGAAPARWDGGPAVRIAGALGLLCEVLCVAAVVRGGPSWWQWALMVPGAAALASELLSVVLWRVTADATGLRVRRHARTRHVPWETVTRVVLTREGVLFVRRTTGADDVRLGAVSFPASGRFRGRPTRPARAAAELTAMVRDPALRPGPHL